MKAMDNIAVDRAIGSRRACRRVFLLTRMRDANSAADETISPWSRANRSSTYDMNGAMYLQMSAYS